MLLLVIAGTDTSTRQRTGRLRSAGFTAGLIPFLFLPYRFLWLPCALATWAVLRRASWRDRLERDGTLILGPPVVLILRTALDPGWWVPWIVLYVALAWLTSRLGPGRRLRALWCAGAFVLTFILLARPAMPSPARTRADPPPELLICAGDSLTSGVNPGTDAGTYVASLRDRLPCRVVNAGVASDRARDLLRRLDRDVLSRRPGAVLLFIGGNDYLDGTPRARFARDFAQIVDRIAASGARLIIVEVPTGIVMNPFAGIFRRAAARHDAVLVPETRLRLWFTLELLARDRLSDPLTIDGIHLTPGGAKRVADWLEPYIRNTLGD